MSAAPVSERKQRAHRPRPRWVDYAALGCLEEARAAFTDLVGRATVAIAAAYAEGGNGGNEEAARHMAGVLEAASRVTLGMHAVRLELGGTLLDHGVSIDHREPGDEDRDEATGATG